MAYNKEYYKTYYEKNKAKKFATNKSWKGKNTDKVAQQRRRETSLRMQRIYGITIEEYEFLSDKQKHICVICEQPEKGKKLAIDHCHTTGKVRGLLCAKCNQGLGHFNDDPDLMLKAINYVLSNNGIN